MSNFSLIEREEIWIHNNSTYTVLLRIPQEGRFISTSMHFDDDFPTIICKKNINVRIGSNDGISVFASFPCEFCKVGEL